MENVALALIKYFELIVISLEAVWAFNKKYTKIR